MSQTLQQHQQVQQLLAQETPISQILCVYGKHCTQITDGIPMDVMDDVLLAE